MKTESLELLESIIADAGGVVSPRGGGPRAAAARGDGGAPAPMESDDELECEDGLAADELAAPFARGLSLCSDGMADAGDALDDDFDATVDSLLGGMADAAPPGAPVKAEEDDDAAADAALAPPARPASPAPPAASEPATAAGSPSAAPSPAAPAPPAALSAALLAPALWRGARAVRERKPRGGPAGVAAAPDAAGAAASAAAAAAAAGSPAKPPVGATPAIALPLASATLGAFFANLTAAQQQQWQQVLASAAGVQLPAPPSLTGPAAPRA